MSFRPGIARPCPAFADLGAAMDGDFCRLCRQTVYDLDAMTAAQRCGLLLGGEGDRCVRYRMPAAVVAAAMAMTALPAGAQTVTPPAGQAMPAVSEPGDIVVGGIRTITPDEKRALRREAAAEAKRERQTRKAPARARP